MTGSRKSNARVSATLVWSLIALPVSGCASSQLDHGPEHPASPQAPVAPLEPVGEALSNEAEPEGGDVSMAPGPDHSHGQQGSGSEPAAAPHASPSSASGHSEHAQGATPAATSGAHDHQARAADEKPAERWTCPMHPEVSEPKPGKCPKCGMNLVPAAPKKTP